MLDIISIFLNLLRFDLWPKMWSILENVPCALEKKVYSAFGWNVLKISMRSISSNASFKTCVYLLIFCFDNLSIGVSGVLKWKWSRSVVSDSLRPHGLYLTRLLSPWNFPGKNTGVGCHFLLQRIFLTQRSNLGLPHCRQMLYRLSHRGVKVSYNCCVIINFLFYIY